LAGQYKSEIRKAKSLDEINQALFSCNENLRDNFKNKIIMPTLPRVISNCKPEDFEYQKTAKTVQYEN
jgi:hypothetical protein